MGVRSVLLLRIGFAVVPPDLFMMQHHNSVAQQSIQGPASTGARTVLGVDAGCSAMDLTVSAGG